LVESKYQIYLTTLINKWYPFKRPIYKVENIVELYSNMKRENIDEKILNFSLESIKDKKLFFELSPRKNILGGIIGKMLGYSLKTNTIIIAKTSTLGIMVRYKIPVIYHSAIRTLQNIGGSLDQFIDKKQNIFKGKLRLENVNGMKFIIWIANFTPLGNVLNILEP
jgi:hypothetical protein